MLHRALGGAGRRPFTVRAFLTALPEATRLPITRADNAAGDLQTEVDTLNEEMESVFGPALAASSASEQRRQGDGGDSLIGGARSPACRDADGLSHERMRRSLLAEQMQQVQVQEGHQVSKQGHPCSLSSSRGPPTSISQGVARAGRPYPPSEATDTVAQLVCTMVSEWQALQDRMASLSTSVAQLSGVLSKLAQGEELVSQVGTASSELGGSSRNIPARPSPLHAVMGAPSSTAGTSCGATPHQEQRLAVHRLYQTLQGGARGLPAASAPSMEAGTRCTPSGSTAGDEAAAMPPELTHVDAGGRASMVDVSGKAPTLREAGASCEVVLGRDAFAAVEANQLAKGDVLSVAQLAGVMGAKHTPLLIPLCHTLLLSKVSIQLSLVPERFAVRIDAMARCTGPTGVEMEALTAAAVAALTVYDMTKAVGKDMQITQLQLEYKMGGRSGEWRR